MTSRQESVTEGWDKMEDAHMVITDVAILSKKEKAPQDYTVIENTHDGRKANFPEGRLGLTTRYICYTKKSASPQRGFVVVTDLKVLPLGDRAPLGYLPLLNTTDDCSKSFHSKQLLARFVALEEATEAIADIIVLSSGRKEEVPPKYKRLPEINGYSICFKMGPVPKKNSNKSNQPQEQPTTSNTSPSNAHPIKSRVGSTKIRKPIDGLAFRLAQEPDLVTPYRLEDNFKMISLQDIEDKYTLDFTKWKSLANPQ